MESMQSSSPQAVESFWSRYLKLPDKQRINSKARRWYVRRAEQYIKAHVGRPLRTHTPAMVTGYLEDLGRLGGLEGWQFHQAVHAIQILFRDLLAVTWAGEVDWGKLQASRAFRSGFTKEARATALYRDYSRRWITSPPHRSNR